MNTSKTIVAGLAALLLLTACGNSSLFQAGTTSAAQETVRVSRGDIENRIIANGRVIAASTATLTFNRVGRVIEVRVHEGQHVVKGDVLARLDTRDLEISAKQTEAGYIGALAAYSQTVRGGTPAELSQARAELAAASQRLKDLDSGPARASIAELESTVQAAEAEVRRAQSAYDTAYATDPASISASPEAAQLEQKTIALAQARARLDAAHEKPKPAQYADARAAVLAAQARLTALTPVTETVIQRKAAADQALYTWEQAKQAIKDATLLAPMDGLITSVGYVVGDIAGGTAAILLADFAQLIFEADVDEGDLGKVETGQGARVRLQSYAATPFTGTVTSIGSVGRQNGSVVHYRVRMSISPLPGMPALLNMSGTAQVVTAKAEDALLVPVKALTRDPGTQTWSVVRSNGVLTETLQVNLGLRNTDSVQVLFGVINAGDTLVVPFDVPMLQVF